MTGRERLLAALRRQPTDRVPISTYELTRFGPWSWTREEPSYQRLLDYVARYVDELPLWGAFMPSLPSSVQVDEETWQEGEFTVTRATLHTPKGDLTSVTKHTPTVKTTWTVEHLCKDVEDIDRYLSMPPELPLADASGFAALDAEVGESGLVLCDTGDAIGHVAPLFGFGEFTIMAMTEPERMRELCDREHARVMSGLRQMLASGCGPLYRIWGPEYCSAPYLPPSVFAELVVPYVAEMVDLIHQHGCYARVHCHGRIADILGLILDTGADAIDPVEPPPDGDITLGEVKARYGERLVLFGNMELKYLEQETPADIDARVKQMMAEAKAGGGYVLLPTSAPINVPLSPRTEANYIAYLEAGARYGRYE